MASLQTTPAVPERAFEESQGWVDSDRDEGQFGGGSDVGKRGRYLLPHLELGKLRPA